MNEIEASDAPESHERVRARAPRRRRSRSARSIRLEAGRDGRLWLHAEGARHEVTLKRCFPWSEPQRHLSLRDRDEEELAHVVDPSDLDPDSARVLEQALVAVGFVLEVERIDRIDEEVEIRAWRVQTRQGPRSFQTPRDEWPREMPGGGLLVRDVAGDLFYIRDPEALDRPSQRRLWALVD